MSFTTPRNQASFNTFGATGTATLPATLAGSLVVVQVQVQLASGTLSSVVGKDGSGNVLDTFQMVPLANPGVNQRHVETWYCLSSVGGAVSIVADTGGATSVNIAGGVSEWAGGASALRTQASLNNASSLTPAAATVTPAIGDLVIGHIAYQASVSSTQQEHLADGTYTAITRVTRGTTNMWAGAYKVAAAATPTGPSWSMDAAIGTGEMTAVFTQAAGAPTGAFTSSATGLVAAFDASGSTANGGASIAGYAWNFGDTTSGTGVSPSHTYAAAGTYTVTLTVTDSLGQTGTISHPVTVTAPAAQVGPVAVTSSTGWTVTGGAGNATTAVSDSDQSTYVVSPATPSASLFRVRLDALITPAAGTDMTVILECDVTGGTGTLSAKLYEGATVRAVAAAQTLATATAGSSTTATLTFTFAAASIANVTNWNALELELSATAA